MDPPFGNGPSEQPDARLHLESPDPVAAPIIGDPGVVGEAQGPGDRVEQVGHRTVGAQETSGLLEGVVEHREILGADELGSRR